MPRAATALGGHAKDCKGGGHAGAGGEGETEYKQAHFSRPTPAKGRAKFTNLVLVVELSLKFFVLVHEMGPDTLQRTQALLVPFELHLFLVKFAFEVALVQAEVVDEAGERKTPTPETRFKDVTYLLRRPASLRRAGDAGSAAQCCTCARRKKTYPR